MLGSLIIYLKGMRRMMFQLSGFYYRLQLKIFASGPEMGFLASRCFLLEIRCPLHNANSSSTIQGKFGGSQSFRKNAQAGKRFTAKGEREGNGLQVESLMQVLLITAKPHCEMGLTFGYW